MATATGGSEFSRPTRFRCVSLADRPSDLQRRDRQINARCADTALLRSCTRMLEPELRTTLGDPTHGGVPLPAANHKTIACPTPSPTLSPQPPCANEDAPRPLQSWRPQWPARLLGVRVRRVVPLAARCRVCDDPGWWFAARIARWSQCGSRMTLSSAEECRTWTDESRRDASHRTCQLTKVVVDLARGPRACIREAGIREPAAAHGGLKPGLRRLTCFRFQALIARSA